MRPRLSLQILPNASTMIGICVTAIGLVKIVEGRIGPSNVDEYAALAAVIFLISALLSYASLRLDPESRIGITLERIADMAFMAGLVALTVISLLFAYEVI
ncbi:MAG TPA: hypothetical protein VGH02_13835 [Rhizomicrobium sp.]